MSSTVVPSFVSRLLAVAVVSFWANSAVAIDISACQDINSPGKYVVTQNLNASTNGRTNCLAVNGVTSSSCDLSNPDASGSGCTIIDVRGYTLTAGGVAVLVAKTGSAPVSGVVIRNGVFDAPNGIQFNGYAGGNGPFSCSAGATANGVKIERNTFINGGINGGASSPRFLCDVRIENNTLLAGGISLTNYGNTFATGPKVINNIIHGRVELGEGIDLVMQNNALLSSLYISHVSGTRNGSGVSSFRISDNSIVSSTAIAGIDSDTKMPVVQFPNLHTLDFERNYIETRINNTLHNVINRVYNLLDSKVRFNTYFKSSAANAPLSEGGFRMRNGSARNHIFGNTFDLRGSGGPERGMWDQYGSDCCDSSSVISPVTCPPYVAPYTLACYNTANNYDSNLIISDDIAIDLSGGSRNCTAQNNIVYGTVTIPSGVLASGSITPMPAGSNPDQAAPLYPQTPRNVTAVAVGTTQVNLAWTKWSNAPVTSYEIYERGSLLATVNAPTTSYSVTGLSGGREYAFQIYARDGTGNRSAPALGLIALGGVAPTPDSLPPKSPENLVAQ